MSFRGGRGKSQREKKTSILRSERLSNAKTRLAPAVKIKRFPLLKDCKAQVREEFFLKKIQQCCNVYDFKQTFLNIQDKEIKRATLVELADYITEEKHVLNEKVYPEIIKMFSDNVFRPLPEIVVNYDTIIEPEDSIEDPSWVHLKLVYQFFLKFLQLPDFDPAIAGRYIDEEFIIQLLETFNTQNASERTYLKTALHRIYGRLITHRAFIRKQINNIFLRFIYEIEVMNGIAELLEICASIINGFVLPLKTEHKVFLQKVLIPMHKPLSLQFYDTQLSTCIKQYLMKDPTLAEQIIRGLLKFWPMTCSQKQICFLNEVEEVLKCANINQFDNVVKPLFKKIGQCIASPHFLVSQRALYFWNNEQVVSLIETHCKVIMPLVFPSLAYIVKHHWNSSIIELVEGILRAFESSHPDIYSICQYSELQKQLGQQ